MANWEARNITLTLEGRSALSKVQSGDGYLTLKRVIASSQYVTDIELDNLTALVPENLELSIVERRETDDRGSVIQVQLDNTSLAEEFTLNELGVYVTHSSNPSREFLYIVAQVSEGTGDTIPLYSTTPVSATYDIYLYNVKASEIEVIIKPDFFVTADTLYSNARVLRRKYLYEVDDIAYHPTLKSCYNLRCVVGGYTQDGLLDFSTYVKGDQITDGQVTWEVIEGSGGGESLWKIATSGTGIVPKDIHEMTPEEAGIEEETIRSIVEALVEYEPVGFIKAYAGNETVPEGYLLCNGAEVGRATYPDLFAKIGTIYGAGDGSTTFNLPNFVGRFAEGTDANAGEYKEAGLPNIIGSFGTTTENSLFWTGNTVTTGAFTHEDRTCLHADSQMLSVSSSKTVSFDASKSNSIYGNSDTVQPPALKMTFYIKAFNKVNTKAGDLDVTALANDVVKLATRRYVKDSYSDNDGNWYRVYSDGWVEQGGQDSQGNIRTITLLKPMANTAYNVMAIDGSDSSGVGHVGVSQLTTTSFRLATTNTASSQISFWRVEGQGAE